MIHQADTRIFDTSSISFGLTSFFNGNETSRQHLNSLLLIPLDGLLRHERNRLFREYRRNVRSDFGLRRNHVDEVIRENSSQTSHRTTTFTTRERIKEVTDNMTQTSNHDIGLSASEIATQTFSSPPPQEETDSDKRMEQAVQVNTIDVPVGVDNSGRVVVCRPRSSIMNLDFAQMNVNERSRQ